MQIIYWKMSALLTFYILQCACEQNETFKLVVPKQETSHMENILNFSTTNRTAQKGSKSISILFK